MRVDSLYFKANLSYTKMDREIRADKIIVREKEVIFKMNVKVEIRFSFVKKIDSVETREFDDLLEVLKGMAVELSKIAMEKGRKRISLRFYDQKSALKIASFEKGKFLKDYLSLMNIIMLTDEILYSDDRTITHYEIVPKVTDYKFQKNIQHQIVERGKFSFEINLVKKAYSLEEFSI